MRISAILNGGLWFGRVVGRRRGSPFFPGVLAGVYAVCWFHQFAATFGASAPIAAAKLLVVAATAALALASSQRLLDRAGNRQLATALIHFGLAAWTVCLPCLSEGAMRCLGFVPLSTLASTGMAFAAGAAAAAVLLASPVCLGVWLGVCSARGWETGERTSLWNGFGAYLCGVAFGLLALAVCIGPIVGIQVAGFVAAAVSCTQFLRGIMGASSSAAGTAGELPLEPGELESPGRGGNVVACLLYAAALGAAAAVVERVMQQLMPVTAFVVISEWAGLLLGIGLATAWRRRGVGADSSISVWAACLFAGAVCAVLPATFEYFISLQLSLNAWVSWAWLLTVLRSALVSATFLPIGLAGGMILATEAVQGGRSAARDSGRRAIAAWLAIPGFTAAFVAARYLGIPAIGVAGLAAAAGVGIALCVAAGRLLEGSLPKSVAGRVGAAVCGLALIAGLLLGKNYDPAVSAKLLFATDVLIARQAGFEWEQLAALDDGRNLAVREAPRGTLTVWRHQGVRWQVREDGIPLSDFCSDTGICPQHPVEGLEAIVPLVLHGQAYHVLLLGNCGGAPLQTCLAFPMQEVTWAIDDAAVVDVHRKILWPAASMDPLADKRVRIVEIDPALAVATGEGRFDLIVSNPGHPALGRESAQYTAEFYRRAARKLSADGVFCQRFQHVDFGPGPIRAAALTMESAFHDVIAVSVAPGELVFLGTNSSHGLVRDGLVERLQAQHVRRAFSKLGWDWSVILNVPVFKQTALDALAKAGGWERNSASNGRLPFALPHELLRWGPKLQAAQADLAGHSTRFLNWENVDGQDPDVVKRLEDVGAQRRLMTGFTDQPWSYRAAVREDLENSSRSIIRQASAIAEQEIHPVDKQRTDYVVALGKAAETGHADPNRLWQLQEAAEPYDPLITYFMHHEAAEIYERSEPHDAGAELFHRLHAAYYADSGDRSVRNVARALELVASHPEVVPDPGQRWDHMNALMETLKLRWTNRSTSTPNSARIELNDIEMSMGSLESALAALDRIQEEGSIPAAHWTARRQVLEVSLIRPLRTYRARILPHHLKQQRKTQEILKKSRGGGLDEAGGTPISAGTAP